MEIPGLAAGMPVRTAIDLVFREQAKWLKSVPSHIIDADPLAAGGVHGFKSTAAPVSRIEAETLTERIKRGVGNLSMLLLQAHDGRAWIPLGYSSWADYVGIEFGFSRPRSYELLNHGRVLRSVMQVAALSVPPPISPYAASQAKPRIKELLNEVKRSIRPGMSENEIASALGPIVAQVRRSSDPSARASSRKSTTVLTMTPVRTDDVVDRISEVIRIIMGLESPADILAQIRPADRPRLELLISAADKLREIALTLESATSS